MHQAKSVEALQPTALELEIGVSSAGTATVRNTS